MIPSQATRDPLSGTQDARHAALTQEWADIDTLHEVGHHCGRTLQILPKQYGDHQVLKSGGSRDAIICASCRVRSLQADAQARDVSAAAAAERADDLPTAEVSF